MKLVITTPTQEVTEKEGTWNEIVAEAIIDLSKYSTRPATINALVSRLLRPVTESRVKVIYADDGETPLVSYEIKV